MKIYASRRAKNINIEIDPNVEEDIQDMGISPDEFNSFIKLVYKEVGSKLSKYPYNFTVKISSTLTRLRASIKLDLTRDVFKGLLGAYHWSMYTAIFKYQFLTTYAGPLSSPVRHDKQCQNITGNLQEFTSELDRLISRSRNVVKDYNKEYCLHLDEKEIVKEVENMVHNNHYAVAYAVAFLWELGITL